jgi:zinc D-Ala-D-Ala carboxypeptidase
MTLERSEKAFPCPCCGEGGLKPEMLDLVQRLDQLVQGITVTSGFRCQRHNAQVGGSETSSHLKGLAVDIRCQTPEERWNLLTVLLFLSISRIGIGNGFIHFDIDGTKPQNVIWTY